MNLFGIGLPELIFLFFIALLILGPKDLEKTGNTLGKWLNKLVRSDAWRLLRETGREIKTLPNRLMRETGMDDVAKLTIDDPLKPTPEIKTSIPPSKKQ